MLDLIRPSYEVMGIMITVSACFAYAATWLMRAHWKANERPKFILRAISVAAGIVSGIVLGTMLNGQGGGVQWGSILGVIGGSFATVAVAAKHALVRVIKTKSGAKDRGEKERISAESSVL